MASLREFADKMTREALDSVQQATVHPEPAKPVMIEAEADMPVARPAT